MADFSYSGLLIPIENPCASKQLARGRHLKLLGGREISKFYPIREEDDRAKKDTSSAALLLCRLHALAQGDCIIKVASLLLFLYRACLVMSLNISSTFLLPFALVSNSWMPTCDENLLASSVRTTSLSGMSSLFPTTRQHSVISNLNTVFTGTLIHLIFG